ncbi:hypothetical protein ANN_16616 [Periplaneta americana]|uniref:Uncharacterized protein n=1 Tax=Periplaneta americana TaxID=6978 RepID=A0ABQ8SRF7_PERAM|nr:hypothetical protein ANN_16616 [Periplaneta americana]
MTPEIRHWDVIRTDVSIEYREYLVALWTDPGADRDARRLKPLPTSKVSVTEIYSSEMPDIIIRIDIIEYSQTTKKGYIIDPTIRIETGSSQPEDVNQEKINIYLPTVDYFKAKYQLENIELIGLLIGARGVISKFFESFRKTFELPQTLTADIITSVLKRSHQILKLSVLKFTARLSWLVLLAQSLAFTESRTPDLQRRSAELRTQVPQLRSTALELRASGSTVTDTTQRANRDTSTHVCDLMTSTFIHSITPFRLIWQRLSRGWSTVARMGESRNEYRVLVGRPEGKRPLGRPRRRWEDNVKMDLSILLRVKNIGFMGSFLKCHYVNKERIPNLSAEQSDGITVFRISTVTSLMLHRCRTGAISLQRWWQSPSVAISESDWFLYRAGISRRMTSCTVVSWRCVLLYCL